MRKTLFVGLFAVATVLFLPLAARASLAVGCKAVAPSVPVPSEAAAVVRPSRLGCPRLARERILPRPPGRLKTSPNYRPPDPPAAAG